VKRSLGSVEKLESRLGGMSGNQKMDKRNAKINKVRKKLK
jgi:hypothetical protein